MSLLLISYYITSDDQKKRVLENWYYILEIYLGSYWIGFKNYSLSVGIY